MGLKFLDFIGKGFDLLCHELSECRPDICREKKTGPSNHPLEGLDYGQLI